MTNDNNRTQLTLDFDGGLLHRYSSLLEVIATGTYRHGPQRVAAAIDQAPSNLSAMLSGQRHFPVSKLEKWIEETGDRTPIYYLIERFLGEPEAGRDHALDQASELLRAIQQSLEQARGR